MGHVWTWLESKGEFFTESEKSSSCKSLCSSPDSSLDLDLELNSWQETEEDAQEELEESSSQEETSQLETGNSMAWEYANKGEQDESGKCKQDALWRFLSEVTYLMEPVCVGSPYLAQGPQVFSGAGEQNGRVAVAHKGDTKGSLVHKEEELGQESHLQIFKNQARERSASQRRGNWALQVLEGLPVMNWEAEAMEGLPDLCEEPGCSQFRDSQFDEDPGKKVLHYLMASTAETDVDEASSLELMKQTPREWKILKKEIPPSIMEVAVENTEDQAEDWKDSDFHLSYSNDDSSPCGTPLISSPSTSTASLPLMHLSQDDPLQQHLLFKKTLLSIWKMVAGHRYSGPFLKPVSEKQAPGYKDVVKRPVDLSSIKRNLSKGQIQHMVQFQRDLMLMFQNAIMYNNSNHHIHRIAVEMQQEVLEQLQMLGEALLCSEEMRGFVRRC
ncbi:bromodomain-containing protein 8-like [Python bivittatus]|uniref:Bromodomain-containing protein 8-like n=1 Tax=Python bivittatus TaxID=176946 RepID=A0A9F5IBM3_PYTBI|nr:bromodomain-containing protein 8-like [Python bivittatus]